MKLKTVVVISYRNNGAQAHTVTFRDYEPIEFHVILSPGEQTSRTFTRTGVFDYYCQYHVPEMVGKVIVVDN